MSGSPEDKLSVLALNCGSSSLKFGLYRCEGEQIQLFYEGEAEEIGSAHSSFWIKRAEDKEKQSRKTEIRDHAGALRAALDGLKKSGAPEAQAIGHRLVHGGPSLREHQLLTPEVAEELKAAVPFAPLHMPAALAVLDAVGKEMSGLAQVVCLDTAFHRTMPDVSKTLALPEDVRRLGVERYGFHGLSLESILPQLQPVPQKLVVAHLGNGSSITAILDGRSIDTTMGLTPTGGVMMGTRSGDLDPGALIYLLRHGAENAEKLEELLDRRSGLLGVSGKSSDVRELIEMRRKNEQADLALRMFAYQVRKAIGGMHAALRGMDTLVFTGGIGEHAAELRDEITSGLDFLRKPSIQVLPAQEDLQIAAITRRLVKARG